MNTTIIIFGATGDLASRKLLPALYRLLQKGDLDGCTIIGVAHDHLTAEQILKNTKQYVKNWDDRIWKRLESIVSYHVVEFEAKHDYTKLAEHIDAIEQGKKSNRLVYLATAARYFCTITRYCAEAGIAKRISEQDRSWNRLAYEKPFGHDLVSAHEINRCITHYFDESQIYRVDHYLTKEVVDNIALLRFTNVVLEPLWRNTYIQNVQIILNEELGIKSRGSYYDTYGALSDVTQNHMLELLALIAMEAPEKLSGHYIRQQRADVLENVKVVDAVVGQYEGYRQEKGVRPDSTTETFAALCLQVKNERWNGTPFFLKTGKKLEKKETLIRIKFKNIDCLLEQEYCPSDSNYLIISLYPDATFSLVLNAKKPGKSFEVAPVTMEFCHSCVFGDSVPDAYQTLFEEIFKGELATSVSLREIEASWRIIDAVKSKELVVHKYEAGSRGPSEAMRVFSKKHGVGWSE
jgi:glucose-6-phosphate 1-dehydrogenase